MLDMVDVVVVPVNQPKSCRVVATLDCDCDCWFVTCTVSVPLVLFAIVLVVREQLYWFSVEHALLHAAKAGGSENRKAAIIAAITKFFVFIFEPLVLSAANSDGIRVCRPAERIECGIGLQQYLLRVVAGAF